MSWLAARVALLAAVLLIPTMPGRATTWTDVDVVCPYCGSKNQFQAVMTSGSYIYSWPEKYQLVFWPLTVSQVLYSCKTCRLTLFMGDFEDLSKQSVTLLKPVLSSVNTSWKASRYFEIPMTERLAVAERLYLT